VKIAFAYCVLLTYIVAMFKPSLPVVKDTLAHLFWQMDHLATVHHHYGNDHVHHEIKKDATQSEEPQNNPTSKAPETVSTHLLSNVHYDFTRHYILENRFYSKMCSLQNPFLEISSPPPRS
jgi:hypothetical protein